MRDSSRQAGTYGFIVMGVAAVWSYTFLSARFGVGFAIPVGIVGLAFGGVFVLSRMRRQIPREAPPDEITGQVLDELEQIRGRLQELEERVDFSERMLAQRSSEPAPEQSRL